MLDAETKRRIVPYSPYNADLYSRRPTFAPLRLDCGLRPARRVCPPPARRDAAFAPLRLDCGLRPLADSPSRGE